MRVPCGINKYRLLLFVVLSLTMTAMDDLQMNSCAMLKAVFFFHFLFFFFFFMSRINYSRVSECKIDNENRSRIKINQKKKRNDNIITVVFF